MTLRSIHSVHPNIGFEFEPLNVVTRPPTGTHIIRCCLFSICLPLSRRTLPEVSTERIAVVIYLLGPRFLTDDLLATTLSFITQEQFPVLGVPVGRRGTTLSPHRLTIPEFVPSTHPLRTIADSCWHTTPLRIRTTANYYPQAASVGVQVLAMCPILIPSAVSPVVNGPN